MSELSAIRISSGICILPFNMPLDERLRAGGGGPTVATGRPRLVTVIVPPVRLTSSSSERHFALNSVAVTIWVAIPE